MSSTGIGRTAETKACDYLSDLGFEIIKRNWRVSAAEIDIIARRERTIYFVEVKYRRSSESGSGLEYISNSKLNRMTRAAQLWCAQNDYVDDWELAAVEVSGADFTVTAFIEELT